MAWRALCAASVLFLLALPAGASAAGQDGRPNVLVIMTDDQDFRSMPVMPQTERLIGEAGVTFDRSFVNYPLCCPSRATFLTGQYAHNHGVLWNNWPWGGYRMLDGSETLPVWLSRAGYRTIHIGKYLNEYGEEDPTEVPRGWDDWHGGVDPTTYDYYGMTINHNGKPKTYPRKPRNYSTNVYTRLANRAIGTSSRSKKPFFINLAPNAPHTVAIQSGATIEGSPALPPPRYRDVFADEPMPLYPNFNEEDISDKPTSIASYFPTQMTMQQQLELQDHWRGRMGSLLGIDDMVKEVVAKLRRTGEFKNTVIIFTSDNGWILGEHRLRDPVTENGKAAGVKYVPYEGSSRVPLMIEGPGFPAGRKVEGVTTNADLARTILDVANARSESPLKLDGLSLRRAARSPKELRDRGVFIETAPNPRAVPTYISVRTKRYRYDLQEDGQEGLYDLKLDPWEMDSVHADPRYAEIKDILRTAAEDLADCEGASCRKPVPPLPPPG
ncbi:MAG: sulfatase [Solirubrobacterales bacterium]|nr:sulfatase [Solirubrobacterales bacterium]